MRPRHLALIGCLALAALGGGARGQPLADVVRGTVETNPETRAAAANLRATVQEVNQARGGYFPNVELRADTGRETIETPVTRAAGLGSRGFNRDLGSLTVRQMIYDGGQVSSEVARQEARVDAARARLNETVDSLALRVSEVYLDLLQTESLLVLARENVATHRDTLHKTQRRLELGVGQRADVEQAEGRLAVALATVVSREAASNDARTRYQRIVGLAAGLPTLPAEPEIPADRQQLLDRAAARHPALYGAMAEVAASRASVEGAKAPNRPKLDVELSSSRGRNIDAVVGQSSESTALLVLRYNLFRGGADAARGRELAERQLVTEESLVNVRRIVQEDASRGWIAFNASRDALGYLERHATASAAALKAYRSQFELGRRSLLDLLNAENELFQARSNVTTAQLDVRRNRFRILASMGALGEYFGAAPPLAPAAP